MGGGQQLSRRRLLPERPDHRDVAPEPAGPGPLSEREAVATELPALHLPGGAGPADGGLERRGHRPVGYQGEGPGAPGLRPAGRQAAGQHPALRQRLVLRLQHPRAVWRGCQGHRRGRPPSPQAGSLPGDAALPHRLYLRPDFSRRGRTWAAPSCRRFGKPWETRWKY